MNLKIGDYQYPHSLVTTVFSPFLSSEEFDVLLENQIGKNYAVFYHARNGLYHTLLYLKERFNSSRIHIPSNICKVVPEAAKKADYTILYYNEKPENLQENDVYLSTNNTVIHGKKIFSIQDCAKTSILPIKGFDFTMYSFNEDKPISAACGGILLVNNPRFLDFLDIKTKLKKPDSKSEFNSYKLAVKWKILSYRWVRILGKFALVTLKGEQGAKGTFNPNIEYIISPYYTMTDISKKIACTNLKFRPIPKKIKTLNIGCYYDTWGTDKIDVKKYQPDVKVFNLNSGKKLPYPSNTFDEIRLFGVIDVMINPQFILNEIYRILKKDGILRLRVTNVESKRFWIRPLRDRYLKGGQSWAPLKRYNYFDAHTLENRFDLAKFKEIKTTYDYGVYPFKDMLYISGKK